MNIINLTQHVATADQAAAGVSEPADKAGVQKLITFDELPSAAELRSAAEELVAIAAASGAGAAMVGGAPFFQGPLERALMERGITPLYAFSVRESAEVPDGSGGVRKTQVFRHVGFVEAVLE